MSNLFEKAIIGIEDMAFSASIEHNVKHISANYRKASGNTNRIYQTLNSQLMPELRPILVNLCDAYVDREVIVEDLSYKQGFADGMRFLIQGLSWEPDRHV